ncbi:hypothetical protein DVH24_033622 [Malus domestica]|uniref:Uncharacterized protein n=1 Tax=Malus domestica TaxID=3750 RepID=A0A498KVF8_MALDO|nr:hypothetical protein DVH24_033622 [Malus domestica]
MTIFDHLEELRQRLCISVITVVVSMMGCFAYSKDLIVFLEALVKEQGVKFLLLASFSCFTVSTTRSPTVWSDSATTTPPSPAILQLLRIMENGFMRKPREK